MPIDDRQRRKKVMYYNQRLQSDRRAKLQGKQKKSPKSGSFTSQRVELSDYLFVIEGYEGLMYTLYFLAVPYIFGAVFLFFFVAGGDYANFKLLSLDAFLIVWLIGYEIVAAILLFLIFIMFLRHDSSEEYDPYGFG